MPYDSLPQPSDPKILRKLAVLKVNGGLGTSMGQLHLIHRAIYINLAQV